MDSSQTVTYQANVVSSIDGTTKLRWPHNFGAYRLADNGLASGSLLGSPELQMRLKATGAIRNVFCVDAGKSPIQTFLLKHWDEATGMKLDPVSGHFFLYPEHQEHKYMLSNGVYIAEHVFVSSPSPSAIYYVVDFTNDSEEPQRIATYAFCVLAEHIDDELVVEYDQHLHALVAYSKENPNLARIVGAARAPESYEISTDHAMAVTPHIPGPLSGLTDASRGLTMAVLHYSTRLAPKEHASLPFRLYASAAGVGDAQAAYNSAPSAPNALRLTQNYYHDALARTVAMTPNAEINRGVLWAKANMLRVMCKTALGAGFTNDPMNSNNCVGRDAAWFCAGSDYFRSDFSEECLMQFLKRQDEKGLIPEYFDMLEGNTEDFGLNVNDDTPLIVWSALHHFELTGDYEFLEKAYPALLKAGRYLASQRNDQGLIWCTSQQTGSKGIAGWRNVIKDYRLSGAVTEVNAECYAAFGSIAKLAAAANDEQARSEFEELAGELKDAINKRLYNPGNGLYHLNIDVNGKPRSDITGDLVFPVMFGVAEHEVAAQIIRRLSDRDFWTPGGMRTIPHDAINYTPDGANGCLGGVWNGLTFWYAKAAAEYLPDFVEEALVNGFENYARNPQRNNTVPGEFSEWLHGQTLVNEGMLLSPWFPPRYIWAVIEGQLGFDLSAGRARIAPQLPSGWSWSGIRNMPYRGTAMTWFCARVPELRIWASAPVDADSPLEVLQHDGGDSVMCSGDEALASALRDGGRIVAIVGNTSDRAVTTAIRFRDVAGDFTVRRYDGLMRVWKDGETLGARELQEGLTVLLGPKGFYLLELTAR